METSFSLPAIMEREIDALIRAGYYSSISEAAKDAFTRKTNVVSCKSSRTIITNFS